MLMETREDFEVIKSKNFETFDIGIKSPQVLFDILCDRTYSNPLVTMIQEYMSNARDAHREISNQDTPIEVILPTEIDPYLTITDFGPGLSPERMRDVFVFLGESTKRDSNDQHGGFGIGAKIGFAYTDTFHIVSRYNGIEIEYMAYKGPDKIGHVDKVYERETEQPNGVSIQLHIEYRDFDNVGRAVLKCSYFWRIQPEIHNLPTTLSSVHRKNWDVLPDSQMLCLDADERKDVYKKILDVFEKPLIVVDRIIYGPLKEDSSYRYYNIVKHVVIFVSTGEVTVAVNRENLQYNETTSKRLEDIIRANIEVSEDRAKSTLINTDAYDLTGLSEYLNRVNSGVVTKVELNISWGHYDILYKPTQKHKLWLVIPNEWSVYKAIKGAYQMSDTTISRYTEHKVKYNKRHLYLLPINTKKNYYILDDRDTARPSILLTYRWMESIDRKDICDFFILRHDNRLEKTDEWIFTVASELDVDLLSNYKKKPKNKKGTRQKYRLFSALAPSQEISLQAFQDMLEIDNLKILIATKRSLDKHIRTKIKHSLAYLKTIYNKSQNDYRMVAVSNKKAYKELLKDERCFDLHQWYNIFQHSMRSFYYEQFKLLQRDIHEHRRLEALISLFWSIKPEEVHTHLSSESISLMMGIQESKKLLDLDLLDFINYNVYSHALESMSDISHFPVGNGYQQKRWTRYLVNFYPERLRSDRHYYDIKNKYPLFDLVLQRGYNIKENLIAELIECINYKCIKGR